MRVCGIVCICVAFLALNACTLPAYRSTLDPLQLQAIQTEDIETSKRTAFAAVVSVFQDLGYVIEEADLDTGLITAQGATQSRKSFWSNGTTHMITPRATAFVEEIRPNDTKVRLNFVERHSKREYYGGGGDEDIPNEDAAFYDQVFAKVHEAVFTRSAMAE